MAVTILVVMASPNSGSTSGGPAGAPIDWSAVWVDHGRWLRTVVLARVGERRAVEEVMQEIAVAAIQQRAPLTDRSKLGPWLYRVAVRQSLLYRRRLGRQRKLTQRFCQDARPVEVDPRAIDPLDWLLAHERQRLVRAAIAQLAPRDAEILLLKYTEDWSYRDLAAHLGASESAVEARLHRARHRLRKELLALDPVGTNP